MQKQAQNMGKINRFLEKARPASILEKVPFLNAPGFKEAMDELRENDSQARAILLGKSVGSVQNTDNDNTSAKNLLKEAKKMIDRREYMSAISYLGRFKRKVKLAAEQINDIKLNIDQLNDKFFTEGLDDDVVNNLRELDKGIKSRKAALEGLTGFHKKAALGSMFINLFTKRGRALAAWESKNRREIGKIKNVVNKMYSDSMSMNEFIVNVFDNMLSLRSSRDISGYSRIANRFLDRANTYESLFNNYYEGSIRRLVSLLPPEPMKKLADAVGTPVENVQAAANEPVDDPKIQPLDDDLQEKSDAAASTINSQRVILNDLLSAIESAEEKEDPITKTEGFVKYKNEINSINQDIDKASETLSRAVDEATINPSKESLSAIDAATSAAFDVEVPAPPSDLIGVLTTDTTPETKPNEIGEPEADDDSGTAEQADESESGKDDSQTDIKGVEALPKPVGDQPTGDEILEKIKDAINKRFPPITNRRSSENLKTNIYKYFVENKDIITDLYPIFKQTPDDFINDFILQGGKDEDGTVNADNKVIRDKIINYITEGMLGGDISRLGDKDIALAKGIRPDIESSLKAAIDKSKLDKEKNIARRLVEKAQKNKGEDKGVDSKSDTVGVPSKPAPISQTSKKEPVPQTLINPVSKTKDLTTEEKLEMDAIKERAIKDRQKMTDDQIESELFGIYKNKGKGFTTEHLLIDTNDVGIDPVVVSNDVDLIRNFGKDYARKIQTYAVLRNQFANNKYYNDRSPSKVKERSDKFDANNFNDLVQALSTTNKGGAVVSNNSFISDKKKNEKSINLLKSILSGNYNSVGQDLDIDESDFVNQYSLLFKDGFISETDDNGKPDLLFDKIAKKIYDEIKNSYTPEKLKKVITNLSNVSDRELETHKVIANNKKDDFKNAILVAANMSLDEVMNYSDSDDLVVSKSDASTSTKDDGENLKQDSSSQESSVVRTDAVEKKRTNEYIAKIKEYLNNTSIGKNIDSLAYSEYEKYFVDLFNFAMSQDNFESGKDQYISTHPIQSLISNLSNLEGWQDGLGNIDKVINDKIKWITNLVVKTDVKPEKESVEKATVADTNNDKGNTTNDKPIKQFIFKAFLGIEDSAADELEKYLINLYNSSKDETLDKTKDNMIKMLGTKKFEQDMINLSENFELNNNRLNQILSPYERTRSLGLFSFRSAFANVIARYINLLSEDVSKATLTANKHSNFLRIVESMVNESPIILTKYISKYATLISRTDPNTSMKLMSVVNSIVGK